MKKIVLTVAVIAALSTAAFASQRTNDLRDKEYYQSSNGRTLPTKTCDGAEFVVTVGNAMDRAARNGSPAAFSAAAARFLEMPSVSFAALGRYRKLLPPSQEAKYLALTRDFIGRFMADQAGRFHTAGITIVNCSGLPSAITVSARLANGHKLIARLRQTGSRYRIIDINVESIWLVQQMRSSFVGTIRRGGIDALFKNLQS